MTAARPRVAFFYSAMRRGGVERLLLNILDSIDSQEFSVDLLLSRAEGEMLDQVPKRVRVVDLRSALPGGGAAVLSSGRGLHRYIRQEKPQVITAAPGYGVFTVLPLARLYGCAVFAMVDTDLLQFARAKRRHLALPTMVRVGYPYCNFVLASYESAMERLMADFKLNPEKVKLLPSPVITASIYKLATEPANHRWFSKNRQKVILGIGRLEPEKDFESLIKAFAMVKEKIDARLLILGEGSRRADLEKLVGEMNLQRFVDLPGFDPNPYKYLDRCDLFVLSSRWEGVPGTLIESLALGIPVVATDCASGGPAEILGGGRYGELVKVGDINGLAVAMQKKLSIKESESQSLRARGAEFSAENWVAQFKNLVSNL